MSNDMYKNNYIEYIYLKIKELSIRLHKQTKGSLIIEDTLWEFAVDVKNFYSFIENNPAKVDDIYSWFIRLSKYYDIFIQINDPANFVSEKRKIRIKNLDDNNY